MYYFVIVNQLMMCNYTPACGAICLHTLQWIACFVTHVDVFSSECTKGIPIVPFLRDIVTKSVLV